MNKPLISIICALSENRAIGKDNKLLFHIAEDLKHFKEITLGHPVIMGRKTFESIGKLLPGRINVIVSRNPDLKVEGGYVFASLDKAIDFAKEKDKEEIFLIGGGEIYKQGLPLADKLYLTLIKGNYEADTFFPDYSEFRRTVNSESRESEGYQYKFLELER
ncbi:MAG: dihydrofolate reductase [uncultured bacterium]|nr:MAG: dihydrofolate reductase [uncultured bacterium]